MIVQPTILNFKEQLMDSVSVIIPAAGLGTRMRPLSNGLSKTLIPLNGKPILSWILDQLKNYDGDTMEISEIVIVTNHSGDIKRFLDTVYQGTELYSKIRTVIQNRQELPGPGGAILTAMKEIVPGSNVFVWLGDTVCLYPLFDFRKSFLAIAEMAATTAPRWCIPNFTEDHKLYFLNKPTVVPETEIVQALIGIYYMRGFAPDYNNYVGRESEIEISELIMEWDNSSNKDLEFVNAGGYWFDCGELDSFYESKAKLLGLTCREQSSLAVNPYYGIVSKCSNTEKGIAKLENEYQWFIKRNGAQKLFIPKIIDHDENSYTMDLVPGSTLADILIYENVPKMVFFTLVRRAVDIYHEFFVNYFDNNEISIKFVDTAEDNYTRLVNKFYKDRAISRLKKNELLYNTFVPEFDIKNAIGFIEDLCDGLIAEYSPKKTNMIRTDTGKDIHGDFHLGNILFDSMTGKYTFLDPRGGEMYLKYADTYYDMAKLYHDIYCGYLLIVKGIYTINEDQVVFSDYYQEYFDFLVEHLDRYLTSRYNYNCELIKKLAIMQMLTCVPFHLDNPERCKGFILRTMNLINKSKKE